MPSGRRGHIEHGMPLLDAARELGVEIESICAGRLTCGKCKVRVEDGNFQKLGIVSRAAHLSEPAEEERALLERIHGTDCRLSCSAHVQGDLLITVPEESRAHKQVIRKSATERAIQVAPAVRQVYVTVDEAQLGEHRGDWGRLQTALAEQWNLHGLTIDLLALRKLQVTLRQGKWAVTVALWQDREVIDIRPGYVEGVYGLAVDIGSTTVAGYLCDLRTGELLATESMMNPQVSFGEDLMSRISYSMTHADGLDKMQTAILETLNRLAANAAREAGIRARDIYEAVLVGNTTMMHIFLGIDPIELGGAPFALANRDSMDIKARDLGLRLHPSANVHILPAQAGHVGADNVGVLIAEEPYNQSEITLIIDVGTNAEIDLGNQEKMLSASSPTGPAFEGGQISAGMRAAPGAIERVRIDPQSKTARFRVIGEDKWSDEWQTGPGAPLDRQPAHLAAGICGSGIIEAVAEMYLTGIINSDGRIIPDENNECLVWDGRKGAYLLATGEQTANGSPMMITQEDIRNIQLAKAALYAGAKLLMNRSGIQQVNRIILAGAFGSYIDPKYALILGLIPDCSLERVYAVGNAAGDGARIALLDRHKREEAQEIAHWIRYIETAVDPEFQREFVDAMYLPHRRDPYPHLAGILPKSTAVPHPRGERRRRTIHQV
ncbi:MAG: ferredoxin [Chloroflexi bacterium RBG_16_52_11]|nr:MAG: ferredoxin [Chloroflexi bacterium RBG_16_52_11]